jgi:hypothetical protein
MGCARPALLLLLLLLLLMAMMVLSLQSRVEAHPARAQLRRVLRGHLR